MADYNLGTARGKIKVDYDGKGVEQAQQSFDGLNKSNKSLKSGFGDVGKAAGVSSLAIAAGIGYATKVAIDFEKQVSAIGAVSGATGEELEALRKKALDLGASTAFSASEAALAMEELAKAGVPLEGILNGAADATVALAAAGGVALPLAAEIASNAMNQFQLKAEDLPKVADLIAGAANASAISVEEFGFSLQQAGAVANLVGVSFDDLAVAIALMGKQGIKGSDAGTSLKTMLSNLQPQTDKQIGLMQELGIVTEEGANQFFNAQGELKSLAEVAEILQTATEDMTAAQKSATLETIFGSDAIRAAAILTGAGAEGFNELATAMGKIKAADVAAARLDNAAGAIEAMKGSLETAAINMGTIFLPAVKQVAQFIGDLANRFSNLDPRWQKLITYAIVAAGAAAALIAVIAGLGFAVLGVGASFVALKVTAIILGIIAAAGTLAAGIYLLWKRSEEFRDAISTAFRVFMQNARDLITTLRPFVAFIRDELIPMIGNGIKDAVDKLRPAFVAIAEFIDTKVAPALTRMRAALADAMPAIITVARFVGMTLVGAFRIAAAILGFLVPIILKLAGFALPGLTVAFMVVLNSIRQFVAFVRLAVAVISAIVSAIVAAFTFLVNDTKSRWNAIKAVISAVVGAIKAAVSGAFNFIVNDTRNRWNAILAVIRGVINTVKSVVSSVFNFIVNDTRNRWNAIKSIVSGAINGVLGAIRRVQQVVGIVRGAFNSARTAAVGAINSLLSTVRGIPGRISGALSGLGSLLYNKGRDVIRGFINGITSMIGAVRSAASRVVSAVTNFLPGSPAKEGPLSGKGYALYRGEALTEDFAAGLLRASDEAARAALGLVSAMSNQLPVDQSISVQNALAGATIAGVAGTASTSSAGATGDDGGTFGPYIIRIGEKTFATLVIDAVTGAPQVIAETAEEGTRQRRWTRARS